MTCQIQTRLEWTLDMVTKAVRFRKCTCTLHFKPLLLILPDKKGSPQFSTIGCPHPILTSTPKVNKFIRTIQQVMAHFRPLSIFSSLRSFSRHLGVRYCKTFLEKLPSRNIVTLPEFQNANDSYLISGSLSFKSSVDRLA